MMKTTLLEIGGVPGNFREDTERQTISEQLGVHDGLREYHSPSAGATVETRHHNITIDSYLNRSSLKGLRLALEFDERVTDCWSVDGHTNELVRRDLSGGRLQAMLSSWYEDAYSANHPFARSEYNLTFLFVAMKLKSGWVAVYSSDLRPQFGRLVILTEPDQTKLEFYFEKELSSRELPYKFPGWNIRQGHSLDALIADFEKETSANRPVTSNSHYPPFDRALFLHGESSYGEPLLTFAQMHDILHKMRTFYDPSTTLVYLPGWEGAYDMARPRFSPSEACGGEDGFASLCRTAHAQGYRIMPHVNMTGINPWSEHWQEFKGCITRNHNQEERWWRFDVDDDGREEAYLAYLNPGYDTWSDYFSRNVKTLVEHYHLQALYLDQSSLFWNDPNANYSAGKLGLLTRLSEDNPGLVLGGEGIVQSLLPYTPVIQMSLPSIRDCTPGRKTLFDAAIRKLPFLTLPAADGSETVYPPRCRVSMEAVDRAYSEFIGFNYLPTIAFGRGGWNAAAERRVRQMVGHE